MGAGPSRDIQSFPSHKRRRNIYLACVELNAVWDEDEVSKFDRLWNDGVSIAQMAEAFDRKVDEIALLEIDRASRGHIQPRRGGAFGWLDHIWAEN